MLILTRREGESVIIKDADTGAMIATVKVMRVKNGGKDVRLGFEAAPQVKFLRDELEEHAHAD